MDGRGGSRGRRRKVSSAGGLRPAGRLSGVHADHSSCYAEKAECCGGTAGAAPAVLGVVGHGVHRAALGPPHAAAIAVLSAGLWNGSASVLPDPPTTHARLRIPAPPRDEPVHHVRRERKGTRLLRGLVAVCAESHDAAPTGLTSLLPLGETWRFYSVTGPALLWGYRRLIGSTPRFGEFSPLGAEPRHSAACRRIQNGGI